MQSRLLLAGTLVCWSSLAASACSANPSQVRHTSLDHGIAGTWFWIDPTNDVVLLGIIQRWASPSLPDVAYLHALTYRALLDPST